MLPEIEIGDVVYIHDTGAHGFSMGYNYNGKLRSAEVLLKEDGSHQLIRRAETPEDYFATFDFEPFRSKNNIGRQYPCLSFCLSSAWCWLFTAIPR